MGDWSFEESGKAGTALVNYALTGGTAMRTLSATNTKAGSLARLDILPDFDSELALFALTNYSGSNNLIDISFGTMPEHIIVENLLTRQYTSDARHNYLFPLALPARQTLYGRNQGPAQGNLGPTTSVRVFGRGLASCPIAGSIVRSYGVVTTAATWGTAIDPGVVANVKSAWVQLGVLTERALYLNVGFYKSAGTTDLPVWLIDIGIGPSGSEVVLLPNLPARHQHNSHTNSYVHGPFPVNLPTGTRLAARVACDSSRSGDRLCDVAVYATS